MSIPVLSMLILRYWANQNWYLSLVKLSNIWQTVALGIVDFSLINFIRFFIKNHLRLPWAKHTVNSLKFLNLLDLYYIKGALFIYQCVLKMIIEVRLPLIELFLHVIEHVLVPRVIHCRWIFNIVSFSWVLLLAFLIVHGVVGVFNYNPFLLELFKLIEAKVAS